MFTLLRYSTLTAVLVTLLWASGCTDQQPSAVAQVHDGKTDTSMDVYKTESCECCNDWIKHIQQVGFATDIHHPASLDTVKREHGIAPRFQSCHTAISRAGYVFEGHVPARFIQQFLNDPPADAIGLAVPGMPVGSPGMEIGDRFDPYAVLLLKKDGSSEIYAEVGSASEQYP